MHVRSWFTVMAFLATGAVSLPTPIPNGDLTAAADKSYEGVQWNGGGNRQRRNEKATADKSYEGVQWNGGGARERRNKKASADKSYEGAMKRGISATMTSNGGVARARRDGDIAGARADGSIQSNEETTADKSYLGVEAR